MSQRNTESASFINTQSFMSSLDNRQLKFVTNVHIPLVTIFNWLLSSKVMKLRVLIKEALAVLH